MIEGSKCLEGSPWATSPAFKGGKIYFVCVKSHFWRAGFFALLFDLNRVPPMQGARHHVIGVVELGPIGRAGPSTAATPGWLEGLASHS